MTERFAVHLSQDRFRWSTAVAWILVVAWAAFIFAMSAHTGADLSDGDDLVARVKRWLEAAFAPLFGPETDIVSVLAHFCEFTVLGALLANAVADMPRLRGHWLLMLVVSVAVASAYAVTDEIHQIFVPGRVCDVLDWAVDTMGAALGASVWLLIVWKRAQGRLLHADEGN